MAKLFGWGTSSDKVSDSEGTWGSDKVNEKTGQRDSYVGTDKSSGNHCHGWNNPSTGEIGVVHRGECKVCKDNTK